MEKGLILKTVAAGILFGMLFVLVLVNKMSADSFEALAIGALGAIGGHVTTRLRAPLP
jgi:hypothetical protein